MAVHPLFLGEEGRGIWVLFGSAGGVSGQASTNNRNRKLTGNDTGTAMEREGDDDEDTVRFLSSGYGMPEAHKSATISISSDVNSIDETIN